MRSGLLLRLALCVPSVLAFYPFYPPYRCDEYHDCKSPHKRQLEADLALEERTSSEAAPVVLEIAQRRASVSLLLQAEMASCGINC